MWEFLVIILQFGVLLFNEFFSAQADAKKKNEAFKIDQKRFQELVKTATQKMVDRMPKDSAGAGNAWDAADRERKK